MNPQPNFNWMPLSEAKQTLSEDTYVWAINPDGKNSLYICQLWELSSDRNNFWMTYYTGQVCRALVPEVPSWEEQSE